MFPRLRPDIQALEEGNIDLAASEKNRLEEKQRETRKQRSSKRHEWKPRYVPYCYDDDRGGNTMFMIKKEVVCIYLTMGIVCLCVCVFSDSSG